jgi:NlpC/P60 family putative phage cell wall peptidase
VASGATCLAASQSRRRPTGRIGPGEETLLRAARRWLREIPVDAARAGDVLLFRMIPESPAKHCAILSVGSLDGGEEPRMIHAYWGRAVVESWMGVWWRRRLVAAFAWPGMSPGAEVG